LFHLLGPAHGVRSQRRTSAGRGVRHVDDDVEAHEFGARGHGLLPLPRVRGARIAVPPRGEGLLVGPLRHDEVALLPLRRAEQLEALEAGGFVDGALALGEAALQLLAGLLRDADRVDLDDAHAATLIPLRRGLSPPGRRPADRHHGTQATKAMTAVSDEATEEGARPRHRLCACARPSTPATRPRTATTCSRASSSPGPSPGSPPSGLTGSATSLRTRSSPSPARSPRWSASPPSGARTPCATSSRAGTSS